MIKIKKFNEGMWDGNKETVSTKYGYVTYYIYDEVEIDRSTGEEYKEKRVHIDFVYVYPEYRRQGHARELINKTLKDIENKYPKLPIYMVAEPKEDNIDMGNLVEFYEDMGFEVVSAEGDSVILEY